ncbi:MAG: MTAP family purine nucleoside phosphorylase [bacterium]
MSDSNYTLGLICGTNLLESDWFEEFERTTVHTDYGTVPTYEGTQCIAIQRHEAPDGSYSPPHTINHKGHIKTLARYDVDHVFAVQSVGSVDPDIEPGSFIVPDDFFHPWELITFYDDDRGHGVAEFDPYLRVQVLDSLENTTFNPVDSGVYAQTLGPRFETPAEAEMLSDYADVVGMTAASEVSLACEMDLSYATLCSVDNYVNGIDGTSITMEQFKKNVEKNQPRVINGVEAVLDSLLGGS